MIAARDVADRIFSETTDHARPNQSDARREELIPIIASAFAELGYRRATISELAARCGVRQNILYRLWPDKKQMFIASIGYVYEAAAAAWRAAIAEPDDAPTSTALRLLEFESLHHGEFGRYRIIFAGLNETDDPDVQAALRRMYKHFQKIVHRNIREHRTGGDHRPNAHGDEPNDELLVSWAIVGLGTIANIMKELNLATAAERKRMMQRIGTMLING